MSIYVQVCTSISFSTYVPSWQLYLYPCLYLYVFLYIRTYLVGSCTYIYGCTSLSFSTYVPTQQLVVPISVLVPICLSLHTYLPRWQMCLNLCLYLDVFLYICTCLVGSCTNIHACTFCLSLHMYLFVSFTCNMLVSRYLALHTYLRS